jgi:hypothetical protein
MSLPSHILIQLRTECIPGVRPRAIGGQGGCRACRPSGPAVAPRPHGDQIHTMCLCAKPSCWFPFSCTCVCFCLSHSRAFAPTRSMSLHLFFGINGFWEVRALFVMPLNRLVVEWDSTSNTGSPLRPWRANAVFGLTCLVRWIAMSDTTLRVGGCKLWERNKNRQRLGDSLGWHIDSPSGRM